MRRLIVLFGLTLAATLPLRAETVNVMSGEHRGFSRLAMTLQTPRPWKLGRDGAAYVLRIEGPEVELDTGRVFSRIARKRISAVSLSRPGEMRIDLACDCHANAFEERPGLLVLDVLDGPPAAGSRFEAALPPLTVLPMEAKAAPARDDNAIYWRNLLGDTAPAAGTGLEPNIALSLARDELMSRLARAASQGLVEMEGEAGAERATPQSPLLHVQTVLDRDLGAGRPDTPPTATVCIADDRVAVGQWAEAAPFADQIGLARSALLGEFDKPSPAAVTRLARLYLHYGMGVEAGSVMAAFPDAVEDRALLLALAAIMEGMPEKAPRNILTGQVMCEGAVALWALLADPMPGLLREIARGPILRTLPELPPDLRRLIGPELSRRLLERGDEEAAQAVATAMARVRTDAPAPAEVLAEARLESAIGRDAPAALEDLAKSNDVESPQALLMLVDARLARGQPVGSDLIEAAGTLAFELRGDPLAARLSRAQILGLGSTGAFEAAYMEFDRLPAAHRLPGLQGELLSQLAAAGSDEGFLRYVMRDHAVTEDVGPEVLTAVATRLVDLGFSSEARALLSRPGVPAADPLLLARAALAGGDARATLQTLAGLSGAEADMLRANALESLGEFAAARQVWEAAGNIEAARRAAWRAGEWSAVAAEGQPAEQAMAARLLPPGASRPAVAGINGGPGQADAASSGVLNGPAGGADAADSAATANPAEATLPGTASVGMLARNRLLLAETQQLRTDVDALLRLHPLPLE